GGLEPVPADRFRGADPHRLSSYALLSLAAFRARGARLPTIRELLRVHKWFWHNWGAIERFWNLVCTGGQDERPGTMHRSEEVLNQVGSPTRRRYGVREHSSFVR